MSSQLAIVVIGEKSSGLGVTRKERRRVGVISERRDPHNRERDSKTSRGLLGSGGPGAAWGPTGDGGGVGAGHLFGYVMLSFLCHFVVLLLFTI